MRVEQQRTLASAVTLSGVGLHSGQPVRLTLRPAGADCGVVFHRLAAGEPRRVEGVIPVQASAVCATRFGTTLANAAGVRITTVEHVLAALAIAGVDNAAIDLDGPEVPILDGSAAPYIDAIDRVGLRTQGTARTCIRIDAAVEFRVGDRSIRAEPYAGREIHVDIDFAASAIGRQSVVIDLDDPISLRGRLARARTFCRLSDIDSMRSQGLSLGGSLDNAIVVDGARVLNEGGLRDPQEFALHKALDLVGDLALLGAPIVGRIFAWKCGHDVNTRFARHLLDQRTAWSRTAISAAGHPPARARIAI